MNAMTDVRIMHCAEGDAEFITRSLSDFNVRQVPGTQEPRFISLDRKIVDADGTIIAGCVAEMYFWKIVYVDILWVDERHRKRGLGTRLLRAVEDAARREGAALIHLDTFDFQAKDFYLKNGYELFGTLEDCPPGHCRYYLKKKLGT